MKHSSFLAVTYFILFVILVVSKLKILIEKLISIFRTQFYM